MSATAGPSYYIASPQRVEGTWRSPGYRSARLRARAAYVAFGGLLLSAIGLLTQHWAEFDIVDRVARGASVSYAEGVSTDDTLRVAAGWYLIFAVAAAITFLAWLSRTVENTPPLRGGTPSRSPREAIGWWFVPFANYVVPYQIVRDVFERLAIPQRSGHGGRVLAWWLLFIASNLVALVASAIGGQADPSLEQMKSTEAIWMLSDIVDIVGVSIALWLIHEMQSRADLRAAGLRLTNDGVAVWPAPPPPPPVMPAPLPAPPAAGAPIAAAEVAFCPACGRPRLPQTRYCAGCGRDLLVTS